MRLPCHKNDTPLVRNAEHDRIEPCAMVVGPSASAWRGGRAAEGSSLLNCRTGYSLYRGFESRPLRFKNQPSREGRFFIDSSRIHFAKIRQPSRCESRTRPIPLKKVAVGECLAFCASGLASVLKPEYRQIGRLTKTAKPTRGGWLKRSQLRRSGSCGPRRWHGRTRRQGR